MAMDTDTPTLVTTKPPPPFLIHFIFSSFPPFSTHWLLLPRKRYLPTPAAPSLPGTAVGWINHQYPPPTEFLRFYILDTFPPTLPPAAPSSLPVTGRQAWNLECWDFSTQPQLAFVRGATGILRTRKLFQYRDLGQGGGVCFFIFVFIFTFFPNARLISFAVAETKKNAPTEWTSVRQGPSSSSPGVLQNLVQDARNTQTHPCSSSSTKTQPLPSTNPPDAQDYRFTLIARLTSLDSVFTLVQYLSQQVMERVLHWGAR
ncbi:uncharacterized protein [Prorops nasuta]|uniref:uncharacterized protein n=1 Tax=Prorops nasuta TaxID=863751 RepID=UPI0034CEBE0A